MLQDWGHWEWWDARVTLLLVGRQGCLWTGGCWVESLGSRRWAESETIPQVAGMGFPVVLTRSHQFSCAGKELTLVQDPTLAPLPSYEAAWPLLAFPPS